MWKAFDELEVIDLLGPRRPRLIAVQAEGCAPIVRAWQRGAEVSEPWAGATTLAAGLRVPKALGDFLALRALRQTGGCAVAVSDAEIRAAVQAVARSDGLSCRPRERPRSPRCRACWSRVRWATTSASCSSTPEPGSNTPRS
jgi:threonine synthase